VKKIIITAAVSAAAVVGFAGTASAFEPGTPQCFGQVHKAVNQGAVVEGVSNVGQLLKALDATGQGKKALVKGSVCVPAE
jgi:hypothetical protein